jgi:hypothetical protein
MQEMERREKEFIQEKQDPIATKDKQKKHDRKCKSQPPPPAEKVIFKCFDTVGGSCSPLMVINANDAFIGMSMYEDATIIRSRKQGDTDGTSNIVLPCPGS